MNVFYHEASGGKYIPRAEFFDLEPGVIGALRAPPLGESFGGFYSTLVSAGLLFCDPIANPLIGEEGTTSSPRWL
jgi:hypothetical protein